MTGGIEPPAKRQRLDYTQHITVLVGPLKQAFILHKDLATHRSRFFKAATAERWSTSGAQKSLELPEDDPAIFAEYMRCLYESAYNIFADDFLTTVKLYILADKLGDLKSANIVIDAIVRTSDEISMLPSYEEINIAFHTTPATSPLRRLMVDFMLQEGEPGMSIPEEEAVRWHPAFFAAVYTRYNALKYANPDASVKTVFHAKVGEGLRCAYHLHDADSLPSVG